MERERRTGTWDLLAELEASSRKWDLLAELEASYTSDTGDKRLKGGWYRYMCL